MNQPLSRLQPLQMKMWCLKLCWMSRQSYLIRCRKLDLPKRCHLVTVIVKLFQNRHRQLKTEQLRCWWFRMQNLQRQLFGFAMSWWTFLPGPEL